MRAARRSEAISPTVRLKYAPQGATLRDFHRSKDWVRTLIGPLGSGKTHAAIEEVLHCMDTQEVSRRPHMIDGVRRLVRKSRWAAVRNTYAELESTTMADWAELVCDSLGMGEIIKSSPPSWKYTYMRPDGTVVIAEMLFLAMDLPKDEKRARGMQLSGVWFNELKELAKNNVDMLMGRVGRFPPLSDCRNRKKHVIGDSNAPDDDHWLAQLVRDWKAGKLPGWWFGIQPPGVIKVGGNWKLNPGAENKNNLDPDYYERQVAGKKETWIRKNLANEFIRHVDGMRVHPDFSERMHVAEYELQPMPGIPLFLGIDFGRSPAAVIFQIQANGQIYVLSEVVSANTSAEKFKTPLRRHIKKHYEGYDFEAMTGDPAGDYPGEQVEDSAMMILNEEPGIDIMPAYTNDFETRTGTLDSLLMTLIEGEPAILVSPSCKTLIKGLTGDYQFRRLQVAGDERYTNKPIKDATSHVCEALHYGLMGAGEVGVSTDLEEDYNDAYAEQGDRPEYYE